ncbi:MAG: O-antigen ligase family protein [Pseudomonadota bacterium]
MTVTADRFLHHNPYESDPQDTRLVEVGKGAPIWEQGLLVLWMYVTIAEFEGDQFLLYPLALYWSVMLVLRRREILPIIRRSWLLFTIPVLVTLSMAWSPASSAAMRLGIFMILTSGIAVYVASRFTLSQIIRCLFFAGIGGLLWTLSSPIPFNLGGPFDHKNILAKRMMVTTMAGLAIAYNPREMTPLRLLGVVIALISGYIVTQAESATSMVFLAVSVATLTLIWAVWMGAAKVQFLRGSLVLVVMALLVGVGMYLTSVDINKLYVGFLDALGKDATLTGRTQLWEAGERVVKERPLFGVGAEGFWMWTRGDAYSLLEASYKQAGTRFNFHNSYYEVQVHLGLVGLAFLWATMIWCVFRSGLAWVKSQTIVRSFFLLLTLIVFTYSFTESLMYTVFDIDVMLFFVAAAASTIVPRQIEDALAADGIDPKAVSPVLLNQPVRPGHGIYDA